MSIPRITKEELKERLDGNAAAAPVLVDARLKYPYEHSTVILPGALRDPDPEELASAKLAANLIRAGFQARALKGGIADWVAAKFPTDTKDAPAQAPPKAGALKG
jgi:hypothetical protein